MILGLARETFYCTPSSFRIFRKYHPPNKRPESMQIIDDSKKNDPDFKAKKKVTFLFARANKG